MKNAEIIAKLNLEQKCALLSGAGTFTTRGCPKAGVPSITLSDGPNGVRKQAGAADHLGLNPSVPATCFPTAATVACSWDPALGEEIGRAMGEEAAAQEVAVLLGPGLNTKRSPLCGRNFEYFSRIFRARWPPPMCGVSKARALQPAPSILPSTVRSCAAWRPTPFWTSARCASCT